MFTRTLCLLTQGEVFGLRFCIAVAIPATVFLLCVAVAIPTNVFLFVLVWPLPLLLSKDFWSGMGSNGFQTQHRSS